MIAAYLVLAEAVKARFYRMQLRPSRGKPTRADRHQRHVRRRAARFTHGRAADSVQAASASPEAH
jgi:hypothetical protein